MKTKTITVRLTEAEADALILAMAEAIGGFESNDDFKAEVALLETVEQKVRAARGGRQ